MRDDADKEDHVKKNIIHVCHDGDFVFLFKHHIKCPILEKMTQVEKNEEVVGWTVVRSGLTFPFINCISLEREIISLRFHFHKVLKFN